ncbi:hypothetical protein [Arabidopsis thaliana]|uniref:Uncharacterized protein AT4g22800 n=2 Tax=Arabidopsis TaxID=3701 RepID=O49661_ARATH|nr:hypothetical protein ISN45_At04g023970 [Arabidopsis thaliana x Arabidopsis arenosa]CAA16565.1 hypothetical protein [Arabidopsis thaliana]CAB79235.1 hypothetical protein [Arabidopsis thaliana]
MSLTIPKPRVREKERAFGYSGRVFRVRVFRFRSLEPVRVILSRIDEKLDSELDVRTDPLSEFFLISYFIGLSIPILKVDKPKFCYLLFSS